MRFAAYGILADGVGSGAGTFPKLLAALLERGHHIDFFGMRGFNHPRSLERFENYRFFQVHVPVLERLTAAAVKLGRAYPVAVMTQLGHVGYQRESIRLIEHEHRTQRYDLVVCTDAQPLARSKLPVLCWPQSPPQTEGAALRASDVARAALRHQGLVRYASIQLFYGYRWVQARAALPFSDLFVCGSSWARDEWRRFGADPACLRTLAYPIDLDRFAAVPPAGARDDGITFLWLGRAVPRKRLDLFLGGFERLHRRRPTARARLVGNLSNDPFATRLLAPYRSHPAISVESAVAHERVPTLFGETDVVVQPSQNENFGFSVAEALAAGRAVVLGPTNGTADYTGSAGFAFSEYRPESVADAMDRACSAVRAQGATLSERAREAARAHFAMERVLPAFVELCREAVSLARRRPHARRSRKGSYSDG
jgi:glycosyltransferase involved in cell wall biosynthesis